ncbi:CapA family protein [Corynebacterium freneyi]|nr:CapA family protein [Corynebacterium freneyi]
MTAFDHLTRMRGTDRPSAAPSTFARSTVAGVDAVTMANNHAFDFGDAG